METKLTIEHLAPYYPYKLKMLSPTGSKVLTLTGMSTDEPWDIYTDAYNFNLNQGCLPILRPLSAYYDINSPAMIALNCDVEDQVEISELSNSYRSCHSMRWSAMYVCFRNHIDVFDLIGKGLAIEKGSEE